MGVLMNLVTEVMINGKWQQVPETPKSFRDNAYGTYAVLAGIRDGFGLKVFDRKGLPSDIDKMYGDWEDEMPSILEMYERSASRVIVNTDNGVEYWSPSDDRLKKIITRSEYEELKNIKGSDRYSYLGYALMDDHYEYSVCDAALVNSKIEEVPYKTMYPTLEEFIANVYSDSWNEIAQAYGHFRTDFRELDACSYLTLEELLNGDYTRYNSVSYKLDAEFYNKFVENGGTLPDCFTVHPTSIGGMVDAFHEAYSPTVIVSWLRDAKEIATMPLHKGIKELIEIAMKYNVKANDIRIVFGFS